jgi:dTDP-4-dehydrorhamnose reductase
VTAVLVTGASGMLGRDLVAVLGARDDLKVTAAGRADLDITSDSAVRALVPGHDVVINAAAWTDVDGAESAQAAATAVNGSAVSSLASACASTGAVLLQVSTDYVFPGTASAPYAEDAAAAPVNAYGRSKLAGETAVLELLPSTGYVVRTAWLYGEHGRNFPATMLRLASSRPTLDVVSDEVGQPTWTVALASRLLALADAALAGRAPAGIYHATAAGSTSRYGLARAVFALSGLDPDRIRPVSAGAFPRPARRPAYTVLGHDRWAAAGQPPMPDWHDSLGDAVAAGALSPR